MRSNMARLVISLALATAIVLTAGGPAQASFAGNQLSGSGGLAIQGAVAGTKIFGTVYVEYYNIQGDSASARVTARIRKGNDLALLYCDNYRETFDTAGNPVKQYCFRGDQAGIVALLPITVSISDIPGAQKIIMDALRVLILQKFFGGDLSRTIYLKSVIDGVDNGLPLFSSVDERAAYCPGGAGNPGCLPGMVPLLSLRPGSIFVMDVEGAVN